MLDFFKDERGSYSIKRLVILLITITFVVLLFMTCAMNCTPSESIINSLTMIAGLCITGTSADKFSLKKEIPAPQLSEKT